MSLLKPPRVELIGRFQASNFLQFAYRLLGPINKLDGMEKARVVALAMGVAWWLVLILLQLGTEIPLLLLGVFTILFVYLWTTTPKAQKPRYITPDEIRVTIICSGCGTAYDESNEVCPNCGSPP